MLEAIFTENVLTVTLGGLYQWDYGQKLYIKGLDLDEVEEIHFSHNKDKEAVVRPLTKEEDYYTVTIPDELLYKGYDIYAWVYDIGQGTGETIRTIVMKVTPRTKPQNFVENVPDAEIVLTDVLNKINQNIADNAQFKVDIETKQEELKQDNTQFKQDLTKQQETFENTIQTEVENHKQEVTDYINDKLSGVYQYKGSVPTSNDLPTTGNEKGDVWNVDDSGVNWAWTGSEWDSLAGIVDLTAFYNKEQIDAKFSEVDTLLDGKLDQHIAFVDEGDLNDLMVVGKTTINVLRTFGNAINAPLIQVPEVYTIISNCSDANGGTQLAIAQSSRIFTRTYLGANRWTDWVEFIRKDAFVLDDTTLTITM